MKNETRSNRVYAQSIGFAHSSSTDSSRTPGKERQASGGLWTFFPTTASAVSECDPEHGTASQCPQQGQSLEPD